MPTLLAALYRTATLILVATALVHPLPGQSSSPGFLLVVAKQSRSLVIVDAATLQATASIPIGEDPHEVVVAPDNRSAFISNYGEGTLHTLAHVDLLTHQPLPAIDLAPLSGPHGLFLHRHSLWVTVEGSKALVSLDAGTGQVQSVLGTGQDKTHLVWVSQDGTRLVASNAASATLSIFDRFIQAPVMVPGAPPAPASYTCPAWRQRLISVGQGAEGFAVSPDEREVWVGNADGTLDLIDLSTGKKLDELSVGIIGANRLRFTPKGDLVLITTHTGKELIVIDAHTHAVLKRIPIEEHGASGIQIQPDGSRAFIACPRDHFVAVVDLRTLTRTATIDAGREPDGLAWWKP